jgi:hypothetical protein
MANASFINEGWITALPRGQLSAATVLHYFATSPFWDRLCINEPLPDLRRVFVAPEIVLEAEQARLAQLRGVEFRVQRLPGAPPAYGAPQPPPAAGAPPEEERLVAAAAATPAAATAAAAAAATTAAAARGGAADNMNLFVVIKQLRSSRTVVRKLAAYLVLDNRIYAVPTLHDIIVSRVADSCARVRRALVLLGSLHSRDAELEETRLAAATLAAAAAAAAHISSISSAASSSSTSSAAAAAPPHSEGGRKRRRVSEAAAGLSSGAAVVRPASGVASAGAEPSRFESRAELEVNKILRSLVEQFLPHVAEASREHRKSIGGSLRSPRARTGGAFAEADATAQPVPPAAPPGGAAAPVSAAPTAASSARNATAP